MLYIGLMSGTSLDGVDGVLADFSCKQPLLATASRSIPSDLRQRLLDLCLPGNDEIQRIALAEPQLAQLYTEVVQDLLASSGTAATDITAIGNHGQTIRHLPELGYTLQIGDPNKLAELTGIAVIADFRRRDLAAGGEGAPLVPAFHHACLGSETASRILINIGGMANISCLSPDTTQPVTGFDTGPGNVLMDAWCHRHKGTAYDLDGAWASQGKANTELLSEMMKDEFFHRAPPKSTGRELFSLTWLDRFSQIIDATPKQDVQATLLELSAQSISLAIRRWGIPGADCYICGGGAHNRALMQRLGNLLPEHQVTTTQALGIDPDWIEATAFAWLAKQRIEHLPGNLPSVTRAEGLRILGAIYPA